MMEFKQGQIIGEKYRLDEMIGQGGFSEVWRATDMRHGFAEAIKIVYRHKDPDGKVAERMRSEYEATRKLKHSNLLTPVAFFQERLAACLVLPFKDGGTTYLKLKHKHAFTELAIAAFIRDIGGAISALHDARMIHFDIKHENILMDSAGKFFLSDLNTMCRIEGETVRISNIFADTPQYRSIEHIQDSQFLTEKVDVFSFGINIYEMCEGIISEQSIGIGVRMVAGEGKPEIDKSKFSIRLEQLIHACWNYHASNRPSPATLSKYAEFYLEHGDWPEINEFNAYDKPTTNNWNPGGRVTVRVEHDAKGRPEPMRSSFLKQSLRITQAVSKEIRENKTLRISLMVALCLALCFMVYVWLRRSMREDQFVENYTLAKKYLNQARYKEAEASAKAALTVFPDHADANEVLTTIYKSAHAAHLFQLDEVRRLITSGFEFDIQKAIKLLVGDSANASILVRQDSTKFYLNVLHKLKSSPNILPKPSPNESLSDPNDDSNYPVNNYKDPNSQNYRGNTIIPNETTSKERPFERKIEWVGFHKPTKCKDKFANSGEIVLKPKRKILLLEAKIMSSGCGRVVLTLSGNDKTLTKEYKEVTEGETNLVFDEISAIFLNAGSTYRLRIDSIKSENCDSNIAGLIDLKDCAINQHAPEVVNVQYGDKVLLFELKIKF